MAGTNKHVVFDVVGTSEHEPLNPLGTIAKPHSHLTGTCISYDNFFEAVEERMGERFRAQGIGTRIFGYCWMEAGEREYTYLSIAGAYRPFFDVFRSIFYRTLWQAGIQEPRKFATDEDREFLLQSYRELKARPDLVECWDKLRKAGFKVWCLTAGDIPRVAGYLKNGGVEMPEENFVSCDTIGIGKPEPRAYKFLLDKFDPSGLDAWFAAAHMWDAAAAKQVGFRGAWCSVWEKEQCSDIFGDMDVTSPDLPALADGIIAAAPKQ
ncbi:uncharacterized protein A1O9_02072 [Exophiala aquamarina CBS 119918]|uniref:2-haloacid dehalogenase n=1 Tax=Exophiala aquamarina CBS 119918 TaxID=1182545 RepID=A0A072PKV2_9EURO|nr:uncharacterized protein A1O9_02072 [Exophiala aquamarina CBS 119918]KEF60511.1 hypothetical protein A1O9_02072 [Exophiala aquamarina CBS 119918]